MEWFELHMSRRSNLDWQCLCCHWIEIRRIGYAHHQTMTNLLFLSAWNCKKSLDTFFFFCLENEVNRINFSEKLLIKEEKFDDSLSAFSCHLYHWEGKSAVKRTRTATRGMTLISFFFSLSASRLHFFLLLFLVMFPRWSKFGYRAIVCCSENCALKRNKKKGEEEEREKKGKEKKEEEQERRSSCSSSFFCNFFLCVGECVELKRMVKNEMPQTHRQHQHQPAVERIAVMSKQKVSALQR